MSAKRKIGKSQTGIVVITEKGTKFVSDDVFDSWFRGYCVRFDELAKEVQNIEHKSDKLK